MTIRYDGYVLETPGCSLPLYNPYHSSIRTLFAANPTYEAMCSARNVTVLVQNFDKFTLNAGALRRAYNVSHRETHCYYREVLRNESAMIPDKTPELGPIVPLPIGKPLRAEYVQVSCNANGKLLFEDYYFVPRPKRQKPKASASNQAHSQSRWINVLILGLDATSRTNFHRHMKLTGRFLEEELGAFEFLAYNKVGDNSFPNLVPLLTGLTGHEVESLIAHSKDVDALPFVWNPYKRRGHTTVYIDEMATYGTFTFPNLTGFRQVPADYYPVPMLQLLDDIDSRGPYCVGSRLKTAELINYLGQVLKLNRHKPMFSFMWLGYVTHDDMNGLKLIDAKLNVLLRELSASGVLEKTALFLISDHGPRTGKFRTIEFGRYEEKNPFFFLALPKHFLKENPGAAAQLEVNQRRMVTAYDLHATLLGLSKFPALSSAATERGLSLMGRIPPERTCADAFVPPEFCACIGTSSSLSDHKVALSFAHYAVSYINALAELHFPGRCVVWELNSVQESSVLGGRVAGKVLLRVMITTTPTAHFEVYGTIRAESAWEKRVDFLQRLDIYGNQTKCLPKSRWMKVFWFEVEFLTPVFRNMTIHHEGFLLETPGCSLPLYNPYHYAIRSLFTEDPPHEAICASRNLTVLAQNIDRFTLDAGALRRGYNATREKIVCHYREVFRNESAAIPDTTPQLGPAVPLPFGGPVKAEYVQVSCKESGKLLFVDYFFIPRTKRQKPKPSASNEARSQSRWMNVLILGIDSTSRMNFHRHMKLTRRYLEEELGAFEFVAFNKAGDNSFPNLAPLLTGLPGPEAESLMARSEKADDLPFVWNSYKRRGYTTLYIDEMPQYGPFTYPNYTGFKRVPADYYPISILRLMDDSDSSARFCVGSRLKSTELITYLAQVLEMNRHIPMFSFVWLSHLTHDHMNGLKLMDAEIEAFLRELSACGVLEKTALFFISDHGPRIGPFRSVEFGRYEDRNPFCFLALPKHFLAEHPRTAAQLEVNQRRLVTAYDLHATLLGLSKFPALSTASTERGLSLMGRIPPERTCGDAFVAPEFCACIGTSSSLSDQKVALSFAHYALSYINALAELHFPG
ncbi:hypothetical protein V5799_023071, partial [Amblyomma americanum]